MENRRRLIKETIDSYKNINIRVSNIQRQKLLGVTEDVAPYIQINQEDIFKTRAPCMYGHRCPCPCHIGNHIGKGECIFKNGVH